MSQPSRHNPMKLRFGHFIDGKGIVDVSCKVSYQRGEYPGDHSGDIVEDLEASDSDGSAVEISKELQETLETAAVDAAVDAR